MLNGLRLNECIQCISRGSFHQVYERIVQIG
ncbi:unnamed protein product, partial [marine sediment metagenome]